MSDIWGHREGSEKRVAILVKNDVEGFVSRNKELMEKLGKREDNEN